MVWHVNRVLSVIMMNPKTREGFWIEDYVKMSPEANYLVSIDHSKYLLLFAYFHGNGAKARASSRCDQHKYNETT
jgi:hypothetical protein